MPATRGHNRWELRTCARRGHITYAPDDARLADRLSGTTGLGEVWRSAIGFHWMANTWFESICRKPSTMRFED